MEQGANTTYVAYNATARRFSRELEIKALVNYRDYHSSTHAGGWRMNVQASSEACRCRHSRARRRFYLLSAGAQAQAAHDWYHNFDLQCGAIPRLG